MENKRLYRSNTSTYLGGVCGGLADYFNIDPVLVRIIFVLIFIYGGAGLLVYLVLWIVIPKAPLDFSKFYNAPTSGGGPQTEQSEEKPASSFQDFVKTEKSDRHKNGAMIGGIVLVAIGTLFLFNNLIDMFNFSDFWPVVLVIAGVAIIMSSLNFNKKKNEL